MAIEYDGAKFDSVEELVKYKKLINNDNGKDVPVMTMGFTDEPVKSVEPTIYKSEKRRKRWWTKQDDGLVVDYFVKYTNNKNISKKGMNIIMRKLNITSRAVYARIQRHPEIRNEINKQLKEKKGSKKEYKTEKTNDPRVNRMRFIQSRIKYLIRQDPRLKYEKAFYMASQEWMTNKERSRLNIQGSKKIKAEDLIFPIVHPLSETGSRTFETMLIDLIGRYPNGKIDFFSAKNSLDLTNEYEWDGRIWRYFCEQFLHNKTKICKALNCNSKRLKIVIENKYHVIRYC